MRAQELLASTPAGLYCAPGNFHIDPPRPVARALITHAHSDHARAGHGAVLATAETLDLMRLRYGDGFAGTAQAARYGKALRLDGVAVTFHPAGHVLGSAQIAVEGAGRRIVASGDYKDAPDPTCAPFAPLKCDVFITEATFGLPVFRHGDPAGEIAKLLHSVSLFPERAHIVGAYSLGKAQRVIALLRQPATTGRSTSTARSRRPRATTPAAASRSATSGWYATPPRQSLPAPSPSRRRRR
jgi:putative mRNA 3-end processing factor